MLTINMRNARNRLSQLVEAVESGAEAEIIINRNGKPVARLVPIQKPTNISQRVGIADGLYPPMSLEDFSADDEEIAAMFHEAR